MEIKRGYTHKRFGNIGAVTLTYPETGWAIDGVELTPNGIVHLANFALQSLQDAYAGAKNVDEAIAAFDKKFDRIMDGKIGTRVGVTRDPVRARAIANALRFASETPTRTKREHAVWMVDTNPAWLADAAADIARDEKNAAESLESIELPDESDETETDESVAA